jgi:hypothetical protein
MESEKFISGMVVYTIKNDDLRNKIREEIINKFGEHPIDQSSYEIHCAAERKGVIVSSLERICENAVKVTNEEYTNDDFVAFYRATNSDDKEHRDRIERITIV